MGALELDSGSWRGFGGRWRVKAAKKSWKCWKNLVGGLKRKTMALAVGDGEKEEKRAGNTSSLELPLIFM